MISPRCNFMINKISLSIAVCLIACTVAVSAQEFSRADRLRGAITPERAAYDVFYYDLSVRVMPSEQAIEGENTIHFKVINSTKRIQVDLFENLAIHQVAWHGQSLDYDREGNAFFINFPETLPANSRQEITIAYGGKPLVAERPPWDGGFVWDKDKNGHHWIGVACEGLGASVWWPNKDHLSEKPDSMRIAVEVPSHLMGVANGRLRSKKLLTDNFTRYEWFVSYPINNYNVTVNIGDYAHIQDTYKSLDEKNLDLDYYVLAYNKQEARKHFAQVHGMLRCYEQLFDKYPFWNDGFAMVETPYWGMEHQGAIAYGNNYQNNAYDFDFIIIHESGHEYWGNSVSSTDHAEMWIHEAFTTYAETLFLECRDDFETASAYINSQRRNIQNKSAIIGPMDVNYQGWEDSDMYYKGSWMLHSIGNMVNDRQKWLGIIKALYQQFAHSHTNTEELLRFLSKQTGFELAPIFDQYLRNTDVPVFTYQLNDTKKGLILKYRWENAVPGFNMPYEIAVGKTTLRLNPSDKWQEENLKRARPAGIKPAEDLFYVETKKL